MSKKSKPKTKLKWQASLAAKSSAKTAKIAAKSVKSVKSVKVEKAKAPQVSILSKAFKKLTGKKLGVVAGGIVGGAFGGPAGAALGSKLGDISLGGKSKKKRIQEVKNAVVGPDPGAQSFAPAVETSALQADADKGSPMLPFLLAGGAALVVVVLLARR